jgi:hypothetical protein
MEGSERVGDVREDLGRGADEYANLDKGRLPNDARTKVRAYAEDPYETAAANSDRAGLSEAAQMFRAKAEQAGNSDVEIYDREKNQWLMDELHKALNADVEQPDRETETRLGLSGTADDPEFMGRLDQLYRVLGAHDRQEVPDRRETYRLPPRFGYHNPPANSVFESPTNLGPVIREVRTDSKQSGVDWVSLYAYRTEYTQADRDRNARASALSPRQLENIRREQEGRRPLG